MRKGLAAFFLLFFALFFTAGHAWAERSQKAGPKASSHKSTKKHRAKPSKRISGIPSAATTNQDNTVVTKAPAEKNRVSKGRRGKTRIAKRMVVPVETEQAARDEKDDGEYIEYRLRRGETLDKVAKKFNIDTEEIVDLNHGRRGLLKAGSVVLIPKTDTDADEETVALDDRPLKPWKNEEERSILVKVAKSFTGAPYRYGGDSVRGLDCSAFVKKMYEIFEVHLPRSAKEQFCAGPRVDRQDLVTGDLVFFKTKRLAKYPTHVGIYIGNDTFIHASSLLSRGVKIDRLSDSYFARTYTGAVRVKAPPTTDKTETNQEGHGAAGSS